MRKITVSVFVLVLALVMVGMADMCAAEDNPVLTSPANGTVVSISSDVVFSWNVATIPLDHTSIYDYDLFVEDLTINIGNWRLIHSWIDDIGWDYDSMSIGDTTITWLSHDLEIDVNFFHQDVYPWKVRVWFNPYLHLDYSAIWSINVLKMPVSWIDNTSWETYTYSEKPMDYQKYLDKCDWNGLPDTGYWDNYLNYTPVTISTTPSLSWTNWDDDEQQTPVSFADSYRVQICNSSTFDSLIADATTNDITYTTPELTPGVYYWRVRSERTTDGLITEWNEPKAFVIAEGPPVDTDGDGVLDDEDAFPNDPDEWEDTDEDGVGDNADAFPTDPAASVDTDDDGYPDAWNPGMTEYDSTSGLELDAFPTDPAASVDTDGDGYPDAWNSGMTAEDSTTGLVLDTFPDDPNKWEDEDDSSGDTDIDGIGDNEDTTPGDPDDPGGGGIGDYLWIILILIIVVVVAIVAMMATKKSPPQQPPQQYPPPPNYQNQGYLPPLNPPPPPPPEHG